ncbi:hypothetical protein ASPCADRAFT_132370 [Aspergillus carbonarius ITEM 5010]|uniref:Uncharacterized protein n=1 Tax=Aspergillus carbonarius (strain ITEM 5010) TaxID=602072 RepID=A0A1R3RFQ6_ASPC5|nr:hypothetical protein ASPCADRAFT_132370 [Aspergillus carbonarius ITEM 5010]
MSKEKAEAYNKHGTVVWYPPGGVQLGSAVYLTPGPGQWNAPASYWHCVISADQSKFLEAKKAWIPQYNGHTKLWFEPKEIDSYLKTTRHEAPGETLRLAVMDGDTSVLQMGISKHRIGKTGPLGLEAYCKEKASELPQHVVNHKTLNNVEGTPQ